MQKRYPEIADQIAREYLTGTSPDRLPGSARLADRFGVNQRTVMRALQLLEKKNLSELETRGHLSYMVKTPEGRVLKNSAVCIRDEREVAEAVVTIRYDVTELVTLENAIHDLISTESVREKENEPVLNVNELLEQLIQKSVELVGKPVKLMNKDDKIKAIQFLSQNGAFLVTKSGDKVAKYFGISKYTLYSYIDAKSEGK